MLTTTPADLKADSIEVKLPGTASDVSVLNMQKRLFLVPDAQVLVTLLPSNDRVELRKLNIDQAVEASGVDYLDVASQPSPHAELGKPYVYTMRVKSKSGGVKFALDAGPEGMKVSPDGKISWSVPREVEQGTHKAIVSVSDASGQSMFHTFSIGIPEVREKLAAQQRERDEQTRLAQVEAQRKQQEERQRAQAAQMAALEQARARAKEAPPTGVPPKPAATEKFRPTMRTWTDSTGQHKLVARFVELLNKTTVVLELEGGEKRNVPLSKLANEDIYEAVKSDLLSQGAFEPKDDAKSPFAPQP